MRNEDKKSVQGELFEKDLESLVDKKHSLIQLSSKINWESLSKNFGDSYDPEQGRPAVATRLLVGLTLLKYLHDLSDSQTVRVWVENPYWQYFCGERYFQHKLPCHHTTLGKWRKRIGEAGAEFLLQESLSIAKGDGLLKISYLRELYADTTVQEKNVAYPSEAKFIHAMRLKLVKLCKLHRVALRQTYTRKSKILLIMSHRYAAAQQYNRQRRAIKKLRTLLGRVIRDVCRQLTEAQKPYFADVLKQAKEVYFIPETKQKIYSLHEPAVEAITKGKIHKKYEYGVKVSVVVTRKKGFVLGCKAMHGNPYDGHTLKAALEDMTQRVGNQLFARVGVDLGYRGHKIDKSFAVFHPRTRKLSRYNKLFVRARSRIEATISLMKRCYRLGTNYLRGKLGDMMSILTTSAGYSHKLQHPNGKSFSM